MHYVVLGNHSPEICPLSNAKTKAMLLEIGPQIPNIAKQHGVHIVDEPRGSGKRRQSSEEAEEFCREHE